MFKYVDDLGSSDSVSKGLSSLVLHAHNVRLNDVLGSPPVDSGTSETLIMDV